MKKQFLILSSAFVFAASASQAQTFKVPQNVKMEKGRDYAKYKKDVKSCIDWLENTPIDQEPEIRREVGAFLMTWMQCSPDVSINVREYIAPLMEAAPADLLLIFMGGCTKYALEHKKAEEAAENLAGLQSIIKFYESNVSLPRTPALEELVRFNKDGRLKEWLADKMKG